MKAPQFYDLGCPTTGWFDNLSQQPVHVGWYEAQVNSPITWPAVLPGLKVHGFIGFCWWDGRLWWQHNPADLEHAESNAQFSDTSRVYVKHWRGRLFRALTDTERLDFLVAKRCGPWKPGTSQVRDMRHVRPEGPGSRFDEFRIVGSISFDTDSLYPGDGRRNVGHGETIREAIDHAAYLYGLYRHD